MHELQLQICYHDWGNWVGEWEQITTQNLNTYLVLYANKTMRHVYYSEYIFRGDLAICT